MSLTAFAEAEFTTMPLIALVARVNTLTMTNTTAAERNSTIALLLRRMASEPLKLPDAVSFKLVDKIATLAPHLVITPLNALVDPAAASKSAAAKASVHLAIVIDTSGSMRNVIMPYQQALKQWVVARLSANEYSSFTAIFFDRDTYGPFTDLTCFDTVHGNGVTYAVGALESLRSVLTARGASDVLFLTDGQFTTRASSAADTEFLAYRVATLPNVLRFTMVFPEHTPSDASALHFSYLPRITPPGIPIGARDCPRGAAAIGSILDEQMPPGARTLKLESPLLVPIAGEFVMLSGMTILQMNQIVERLLAYDAEAHGDVHNFFASVMGLYNSMMSRAGDLLNTLRSPEMRMLWSLLQPMKKRLMAVPEDNVHFCTTALVLEFLTSFEASLCERRDERVAEVRKQIASAPSASRKAELEKELDTIFKAFNEMKRVDEHDRIVADIAKLKSAPDAPASVFVKFWHVAAVPLELFKVFPNTSAADTLEIYKMVASLAPCAKDDPAAMELVLPTASNAAAAPGLVLVMRMLPYRATDEVRMTLTATAASRVMFGFFATQIAGGYSCDVQHLRIGSMIARYVVGGGVSPAILGNITNMAEPINQSAEWIRILAACAKARLVIPASAAPFAQVPDKSLWVQDVVGEAAVELRLNADELSRRVNENTASFIVRQVTGLGAAARAVRITTTTPIVVPDYSIAVLVTSGDVLTMEQWRDRVAHTRIIMGARVEVTNGMILQERLNCSVDTFLTNNFEKGHRLIDRAGVMHPATTMGVTSSERAALQSFLRDAWASVTKAAATSGPALPHLDGSVYPTVFSPAARDRVATELAVRAAANPPFTTKESSVTISPALVAANIECLSADVVSFVAALCIAQRASDGGEGVTDAIVAAARAMAPDAIASFLTASRHLMESNPEVVARVTEMATELSRRLTPLPAVAGVGPNTAAGTDSALKRRAERTMAIAAQWEQHDLREAIAQLESQLTAEDFQCPLTCDLLDDPVMFGGHLYSRLALQEWLRYDPRRSSPLTRQSVDAAGVPLRIEPAPVSFIAALDAFKAMEAKRLSR